MTAYAASSEVNSKITSSKENMTEYQAIEYFTHLEQRGKIGLAQQSKPRLPGWLNLRISHANSRPWSTNNHGDGSKGRLDH